MPRWMAFPSDDYYSQKSNHGRIVGFDHFSSSRYQQRVEHQREGRLCDVILRFNDKIYVKTQF